MRDRVRRWGRLNTVIAITAGSTVLSVILTYAVLQLAHSGDGLLPYHVGMFIGIVVPLLVAPVASWPFVNLLVKLDRLEEETRQLATRDFLTGLLNRRAFLHDSANQINVARREKIVFSILMIDIDDFKAINDEYGHAVGDEVLVRFARATESVLFRGTDLIGRMGGEEFAVLLLNTDEDGARKVADRLHSAMGRSGVEHGGATTRCTISIGVMTSPPDEGRGLDSMLRRADRALYEAKTAGKNRTVVSGRAV